MLPGQVDYLSAFQLPALAQPTGTLGVSDPQYLALLRSIQQRVAGAYASAQQQAERVQRNADIERPRILEQGAEDRQQIAYGLSARGISRSGQAMQEQAKQRKAETDRLGAYDLATADQLGAIANGFSTQIGALTGELAQGELDYATQAEAGRRQGEAQDSFLAQQQSMFDQQQAEQQGWMQQQSMFQRQTLDSQANQNKQAMQQQERWYQAYLTALRGGTPSLEPGYRPQGLPQQGTNRSRTRAA